MWCFFRREVKMASLWTTTPPSSRRMKPEASEYRKRLAEVIKRAPKGEGAGVLDEAKTSSEYWQARKEKIDEVQQAEIIDDGLGVFVTKKTLYHGSATEGVKEFDAAEEDTIGSGIYFTSEPKDAIGYARRRSKSREGKPIIYEASVENMKLLDLRNDENVHTILPGFADILKEKLKDPAYQAWNAQEIVMNALEAIGSGKIGAGNLRDIAFSFGKDFSVYVRSLGYEGLIAIEGGEGDDIGQHDTYLIFDPKKAKIDQEHDIL
ncbi:MAG TPA: hypothetical protein VJ694_04195 [Patescibacteria group bacterium]|nr:hypothetical protein [Patescibacteria group bacterium]